MSMAETLFRQVALRVADVASVRMVRRWRMGIMVMLMVCVKGIREVTKKKSWAGSRDVMNWGMFCLRVRGGGCMTKGVTGGVSTVTPFGVCLSLLCPTGCLMGRPVWSGLLFFWGCVPLGVHEVVSGYFCVEFARCLGVDHFDEFGRCSSPEFVWPDLGA